MEINRLAIRQAIQLLEPGIKPTLLAGMLHNINGASDRTPWFRRDSREKFEALIEAVKILDHFDKYGSWI